MLSLALQILHFETFLSASKIQITDDIIDYLSDFKNSKSENPTVTNQKALEILDKYEEYRKKTLSGEHGKTAQFYMMYIEYIDNYLTLNYSIRLGKLEIFKFILPCIGNVFFTFNQQNYARYIVLYHEKLVQVQNTHPRLEIQLKEGSFGVKRTHKSFSRQPTDLTLEQTINADAANKLTGISYLTNSISARQRWCKSHSIRSAIISHVMDRAGLRKKQDITAELQKNRIIKHRTQFENLIQHIKQNINPFSEDLDKTLLYNISTGQAVNENIEDFLINSRNLGIEQREQFIKECSEDGSRFERPIKKNKVLTFVDALPKKKIAVNGKLIEVRMQRNLFAKLLRLSLENSLDIDCVLAYPLTPIPLSLCHVEGSICKTDKSVLFKILEKENDDETDLNTSDSCDVMIFDGFFIFHQMKDVPITFANISQKLLQIFTMNDAHTIIIVFDRYFFPSIKDNEHLLRGRVQGNKFTISGSEQKRPSNFANELKNIYFKEALVKFLCEDWAQNHMASFFSTKTIYVNYDLCYKFKVIDGKVVKTVEDNLSCPSQEEADTKIVFHACKLDFDARVTIRCSDTDILVIMLGNMPALQSNLQIRILVGTGNNKRYLDVNKLFKKLGERLCLALPAFHALTGCDYNPAFYRKGKKKPLQILRKSSKYIEALISISNLTSENLEENVFTDLEEFVCRIYGHNAINEINLVRVATFMKTYKSNEREQILKIDQKFEGSMLPPCKSELQQHFLRTSYIAQLWNHAYIPTPTLSSPTDFGWEEQDDKYNFKWFEGEQLPKIDSITNDSEKITDTLEDKNENDNNENDDEQDFEEHPNIEDDSDNSSEEGDSDCENDSHDEDE